LCGICDDVCSVERRIDESYSPSAVRASIELAVMRLLLIRMVTTWAAFLNAASVAALSPRSSAYQMLLGASSQTSGAPGLAAASVTITAGSIS
jgi:hypothetical protein